MKLMAALTVDHIISDILSDMCLANDILSTSIYNYGALFTTGIPALHTSMEI